MLNLATVVLVVCESGLDSGASIHNVGGLVIGQLLSSSKAYPAPWFKSYEIL